MSLMKNVRPYGKNAVLIDGVSSALILSWETLNLEGVQVRGGINSVMVTVNPELITLPEVLAMLEEFSEQTSETSPTVSDSFVFPCVWDGEDLPIVAEKLQKTMGEIINDLEQTTFEVAMIGFAPGFPYLRPHPDSPVAQWAELSRLSNPRSSVPAGSVGVAAGMVCIYPNSLPGGWNLLGTTSTKLFDASNQARPSLLARGDRLLFKGEQL